MQIIYRFFFFFLKILGSNYFVQFFLWLFFFNLFYFYFFNFFLLFFFFLTNFREVLFWPVFVLSIMATIIASQALISGAFSLTQQAVSLSSFPRLKIVHTSIIH